MPNDKVNTIMMAIQKYVNDYNDDNINYYDLFDIPVNMTEAQQKTYFKKLKTLFHEDNINYLPEHIRPYFKEVNDILLDVINIFDDPIKKSNYDAKIFSNKEVKQEQHNTYSEDDISKLRFIMETMILKYGVSNALLVAEKFLYENNTKGITRDKGCRDMAKSMNTNVVLEDILKQFANVKEFVYDIITKKAKILNSATIYTVSKYGEEQAINAINKLMHGTGEEHDYQGFTNTNKCRDNLRLHVLPEEVEILMGAYLNIAELYDKQDVGYNMKVVIETYVDKIKENLNVKESERTYRG